VPPSLELLPERLRDAGYATYATTAGVLLTPQLGFDRGFDDFWVRGKMDSLPEWSAELEIGVTDAVRWLKAHRDERFFLFFHTFEAHTPYQPRELATALYDSGLAYIDEQLSLLLEALESEGLMDDTIVVVTSDHGESFFEHGLVGHSSLYDQDLKVPLIISAPFATAHGRRVGAQVRSVDIAPTLAELAGLAPLTAMDGSSLVPFLRGEAAPARDAWSYALSTVRGVSLRTASQRKLIAQDTIFDPFRGTLEVYDLRRDPGELKNLSTGVADTVRQGLVRAVAPGSSGLQIRMANAGHGELSGLLSGDAVDAMVTSPDLSF